MSTALDSREAADITDRLRVREAHSIASDALLRSPEPAAQQWVGKHVVAGPFDHAGIVLAVWENLAWLHYDCGGASTYDIASLRLAEPETKGDKHE